MLTLQVGKRYVLRNGEKTGCLRQLTPEELDEVSLHTDFKFTDASYPIPACGENAHTWTVAGSYFLGGFSDRDCIKVIEDKPEQTWYALIIGDTVVDRCKTSERFARAHLEGIMKRTKAPVGQLCVIKAVINKSSDFTWTETY